MSPDLNVNVKVIEQIVNSVCTTEIHGRKYATPITVSDGLIALLRAIQGDVDKSKEIAKLQYEEGLRSVNSLKTIINIMSSPDYQVKTLDDVRVKYTQLKDHINDLRMRVDMQNAVIEKLMNLDKKTDCGVLLTPVPKKRGRKPKVL